MYLTKNKLKMLMAVVALCILVPFAYYVYNLAKSSASTIQKTANLAGYVLKNNKPVSQIPITLTIGGVTKTDKTNALGRFAQNNLPTGYLTVQSTDTKCAFKYSINFYKNTNHKFLCGKTETENPVTPVTPTSPDSIRPTRPVGGSTTTNTASVRPINYVDKWTNVYRGVQLTSSPKYYSVDGGGVVSGDRIYYFCTDVNQAVISYSLVNGAKRIETKEGCSNGEQITPGLLDGNKVYFSLNAVGTDPRLAYYDLVQKKIINVETDSKYGNPSADDGSNQIYNDLAHVRIIDGVWYHVDAGYVDAGTDSKTYYISTHKIDGNKLIPLVDNKNILKFNVKHELIGTSNSPGFRITSFNSKIYLINGVEEYVSSDKSTYKIYIDEFDPTTKQLTENYINPYKSSYSGNSYYSYILRGAVETNGELFILYLEDKGNANNNEGHEHHSIKLSKGNSNWVKRDRISADIELYYNYIKYNNHPHLFYVSQTKDGSEDYLYRYD